MTSRRRAHTLVFVRRCLLTLLALSVFAFGARASTLHVHAYFDHEHDAHRHGPALHEHAESAADADEALHIEACDPSAHVVRISCTVSAGTDGQPGIADVAVIAGAEPSPVPVRVIRPLDIRGHSPPPSPFRQLRAPPLQTFP